MITYIIVLETAFIIFFVMFWRGRKLCQGEKYENDSIVEEAKHWNEQRIKKLIN